MSNRRLMILVAVILILAIAAGTGMWFLRPDGKVVVTVDGQEYGSYDLHRNRTVIISPADGSWHNVLTIENGTASVTESDCANQICVNTPPLNENTIGIIVCLPHGVAVELK